MKGKYFIITDVFTLTAILFDSGCVEKNKYICLERFSLEMLSIVNERNGTINETKVAAVSTAHLTNLFLNNFSTVRSNFLLYKFKRRNNLCHIRGM